MKIEFLNWEITLKESILNKYSFLSEKDNVTDLLIKVISLKRKENQRFGKKKVLFSKEIKNNQLYKKYEDVINEIKLNFENNQFELNFLRLSVKHQKDFLYNDTMFDILDIEHFHLGLENDNYRSKELLFVKYDRNDNSVYFIDIFNHKNFLDDKILKIICDNWNNLLKENEIPNILSMKNNISNKKRYELFNKYNVNSFYSIKDKEGNKYMYTTKGILSNDIARQDYLEAQYLCADIEYFYNNKEYFGNKIIHVLKKEIDNLKICTVWELGQIKFKEINTNSYINVLDNGKLFISR